MQSYIVRIYRWGRKRPGRLVGVVEEAEGAGKRAFGSLDELWQILAGPRALSATRKPGASRRPTLRGLAAGAIALLLTLGGLIGAGLAADPPAVRGKSLGGIPIGVKATPPAVEVEVFDGNPRFLPPFLAATLYPPYSEASLGGMAALDRKRIGAVTDGESRLLIRMRASQPAGVSFRVVDTPGADNGSVSAVSDTTMEIGGRHYALAVYTPPESFDPAPGSRTMTFGWFQDRPVFFLEYRIVDIEIGWGPGPQDRHVERLHLVRPPVVLVHGTYDEARSCWDWAEDDKYLAHARARAELSKYRTTSFRKELERLGFAVFLVQFRQSSGIDPDHAPDFSGSGPRPSASRFQDNAKVVWDGGRPDHQRTEEERSRDRLEGVGHGHGGIQAALTYFRDALGFAATQADVVGHSMGGVLPRVYARGAPLPERAADADPLSPGAGWYRRADNFHQGDINRLITIGSTHKGSHVPGFLQHFKRLNPVTGDVFWRVGNWLSDGKVARGAFTDQIPASLALLGLGPTRVPAHAIAAVAKPGDLDKFQGLGESYRARFMQVWTPTLLMGDGWLVDLFRAHTGTDDDARELLAIGKRIAALEQRLGELTSESGVRAAGGPREAVAAGQEVTAEIIREKERQFLRFVASSFFNDHNDFVTSLDSALGGLDVWERADRKRYTTILPQRFWDPALAEGILHGFEPRHEDVQREVVSLLRGGFDNFRLDGFPASGMPRSFGQPPEEWRPSPSAPGR